MDKTFQNQKNLGSRFQKIYLKLGLFLIVLNCLAACQKTIPDTVDPSSYQLSLGTDYVPDLNSCYIDVEKVNGLIKFKDDLTFRNTLECLENKSHEMDSLFLVDWGYLDDSLINEKELEIGYNEELVYAAFESNFSFVSLRQHMNSLMSAWFDVEPLDTNDIPSHIIGDFSLQTVSSPEGAFMVEDSRYLVKNNGIY